MRNCTYVVVVILLVNMLMAMGQTEEYADLVWSDEFDGVNLDATKWQPEVDCNGGGNNELQCYTARSKNVFIDDGALVLKAFKETYTGTLTGCTNQQGCTNSRQYTSGRIRSSVSKAGAFLQGRMEIRAKLASGSHLWPQLWMLPLNEAYGGWAASGEIDIMEQRGNQPTVASGTLHHGAVWPNSARTTNGEKVFPADLSADYHVFALEWTETQMKWYVDSNNFQTQNLDRWWNTSTNNSPYTAKGQPWDQPFYFSMKLAVGGNFFNGYPALTNAQVDAWKVSELRVDYVRVYKKGKKKSTSSSSSTTLASIDTASPDELVNGVSSKTPPWLERKTSLIMSVSAGGAAALTLTIAVIATLAYRKKKKEAQFAVSYASTPSEFKSLCCC